jgi:hypothetical protein
MLYLTVASLIVALIAVGFAVKQTNIAKAMQDKQDEEQKEVCDWQLRHEAVAIQLSRINPLLRVRYPDDVTRVIYTNLFPDPALQQAIENYIVHWDGFTPRKPSPHELRSPALRDAVTKVEAILDRCRKENPTVAYHFTGPK